MGLPVGSLGGAAASDRQPRKRLPIAPCGPISELTSGGTPHTYLPDSLPVLRVDSAPVLIPVTVTNLDGAPFMGLARDHFHIFEDKVEQKITDFYTEDAPVSVGLLLDASGSMRNQVRPGHGAKAALTFPTILIAEHA